MKIIDNFIDQESFDILQKTMIGDDNQFAWYHSHYNNFKGDGMSQFIHMFFTSTIIKVLHPLIHPILDSYKRQL